LIDYYAAQLFFANWDWPEKNVKVWNSDVESAPLRYYFFDCDACLNEFQQESIENFTLSKPLKIIKFCSAN